MALRTESLLLDELSADPGTPTDGELWVNGTDDRARVRLNGATKTLSHQDELNAHTGSTSNPHSTTLEQARTAGATIAGNINANNAGTITNLPDPSADQDAANKRWVNAQIQAYLQGLDWQESVLDRYDPTGGTPPGPTTGDRYISTATANGWTINRIYEWSSPSWIETIPNEGCCTRVEDENQIYIFDGATWGLFATSIPHASLHAPGASDALGTAAPTQGIGGGNTEGAATTFARSNHDHKLRETGGPTDLTIGAVADGQFFKRVGTAIVGAAAGAGYLQSKAGRVLAASFAGTPRKATVTFATAMPSTSYGVAFGCLTTGNGFVPRAETKTTAGFVINLGSSVTTTLTEVAWVATMDGEST